MTDTTNSEMPAPEVLERVFREMRMKNRAEDMYEMLERIRLAGAGNVVLLAHAILDVQRDWSSLRSYIDGEAAV